jgi:predicted enzyme related to lactoylglutathione lyase
MGQAVVHFEIIGTDATRLQGYYSSLFGWKIDANNPMRYGMVQREGNVSTEGLGIGGGIGPGPEGYPGHVTFYVEVRDVEAALAKAQRLGGTRMMGPEKVMDMVELGLFADPEGHVIGVVKSAPAPRQPRKQAAKKTVKKAAVRKAVRKPVAKAVARKPAKRSVKKASSTRKAVRKSPVQKATKKSTVKRTTKRR